MRPLCRFTPCGFAIPPLPNEQKIIVVGSSSEVLTAELGDIVDQHDTVVRCNCAPTRGFERHVGSRTSFRVVNQQSQLEATTNSSEHTVSATLVMLPMGAANTSSFASIAAEHATCRAESSATNHHTAFINPEFLAELLDKFGVVRPTTGFVAIAFFSRLFTRQITLYGFSFFQGSGSHHYWHHRLKPARSATDLCGRRGDLTAVEEGAVRNAHIYHNATLEAGIVQRMRYLTGSLYRRHPTVATRFAPVGRGVCARGTYAGWRGGDAPNVTASLSACKRQCASEARCRYFSFLANESCIRYDERAGTCCSSSSRTRFAS